MSIIKIHARYIYGEHAKLPALGHTAWTLTGSVAADSRGKPTVECDLHTSKGMFRASVPSGASTGAVL